MTRPIHCAIGDIHGEYSRLKALHERVRERAAFSFPGVPVQFVHLGDLVDRGPDSCAVIDYLMSLEDTAEPRPVTLRGNHEQMMIDAIESGDRQSVAWRLWTMNGGDETLESYADAPAGTIARHVRWLKSLPTLHEAPEAGLVFVHAGIDPDLFPDCGEKVRMWTRRREFMDPRFWTAPGLRRQRVIHGHTPTRDNLPETAEGGRRLNIDTGAVYGGQLTAALLRPLEPDIFLHA